LDDLQLVDRLVRENRAFTKILRYDVHSDERMACGALTDRGKSVQLLSARVDSVCKKN
jgi:hypothetical protein